MGGVTSEQGAGGSKLNVELNLVPFIDLLSSLVLFLLLTAVWIQIAAIPAAVDSKGRSTVVSLDQSKLHVRVTSQGLRVTWPAGVSGGPALARSLAEVLPSVARVAKTGKLQAASVSGDDGVEYRSVIETIDGLKAAGLPTVAISME